MVIKNGFSKKLKMEFMFCIKKRVMESKVKKCINEFLNRNWSPSFLNKLRTKFHQTGYCEQRIANPAVVKA